MSQHEIKEITPLLDGLGNVKEPGFCFMNKYVYDRRKITANKTRIKEWDFYQITNPRYTVQITVADISIGGFSNITVFDMQTGKRREFLNLTPLTFGKLGLEDNTRKPHAVTDKGKNYSLVVDALRPCHRRITAKKRRVVDVDISMELFENHESLVMAVPFEKQGYFYLNDKMNLMPVSGHVTVKGMTVSFDPADSFCVLDWGRGVWPYKGDWYWGNGTHRLENGDLFGFEIGWGFGDMSAASENMLFFNGKGHKIGYITLRKDENDYMKPWHFVSDDGRFDMTMTPFFDNYTSTRVLGVIGNKCHQVFGKWNGTCVLDDGTALLIHDMTAFCEHSDNRW